MLLPSISQAILKGCFYLLRPLAYLVRGRIYYTLTLLIGSVILYYLIAQIQSVDLPALWIPSTILYSLPEIGKNILYILIAVITLSVCTLVPIRILFIKRQIKLKSLIRELFIGLKRSITGVIYCGARAVLFSTIISITSSLLYITRYVDRSEPKYVIMAVVLGASCYFGYKIALLVLSFFATILSNTGIKNSIRLILLISRYHRYSAAFWLISPFLFSAAIYYLIWRLNPVGLYEFLRDPKISFVISLIIFWYALSQTALRILDGIIQVESRMQPKQAEPEPVAKPELKIKNLKIESQPE